MDDSDQVATLGPDESLQAEDAQVSGAERLRRSAGTWIASLLNRSPRDKAISIVTVAGFVSPAVAYCYFVQRYSVNVVVADQWTDVSLSAKAFSGHFNLSDLWAQHNENRMLFPKLVVVGLAYSTHLNVRFETFASALLLFGSVALIIWAHKRRSPSTPLLWYCPVAILMVTWAQYENSLWGFQIAWYMVLICLMGALAVLNRRNVTVFTLAVAIVLAVIGSYSSLQGLLIWLAGLVLMLYQRRSWRFLAAWLVAAVATTGLYFYHLGSSSLSYYRINPFDHPLVVAKLFLFSLGNAAGKPLPVASLTVPEHGHVLLGTASPWLIALGIVIFACGALAIASTFVRDVGQGSEPLGVALILFSFAFDGLTTIGRGLYGYSGVSASRYTTYDLLALVGTYLVVISRHPRGSAYSSMTAVKFRHGATRYRKVQHVAAASARVVPVLVVACIVIQVAFGYYNGLSGGRERYVAAEHATDVIRNYRSHLGRQDNDLFFVTYASIPEAVRLIQLAEHYKLSLFDSP